MNMNIFSLFTNIFIFVICGGMFVIIPQLTRKSYLFGVRIPPEEAGCEEAVKLKKAYVTKCIFVITVLLAACVVQFIVAPEYTLHATLYSPLLIAPLFFIIYIPNWKKAVMLKAERGWAVSNVLFAETKSGSARGNLSNLPWVWYAISLVIVVLSVALAVYRMPHLPDLIPVHFNAAGEVTRYTEPTWFYVMIVPLANASLVLVMLVSNIIIERAKLQIDSNKPTLSFAQHRIYRRRMGHALGLMTLGFVIVITPLIIPMVYPDAEWTTALMRTAAPIVFVFSLVMCLPPVLAYVFSGQGGCKIKIDLPDEGASLGEVSASSAPKIAGRGDDKYWIWGMFYCNPDDPALFIEDRFGSNISLNYSRLSAKIFVGVTAVVLVGTYVWATVMLLAA